MSMPADERPSLPLLVDLPEPQPVRIRFGSEPYQLLDQAVAERILCAMSERYATLLGKLIAEAFVGAEAATPRRGRPPA